MRQEKLLEASTEQTCESGNFWNASQEFVPGMLLNLARTFKLYPFYTEQEESPYIWDGNENR